MTFQPPISVVVPIYNYEKEIEENVNALLNLDYPEYEVIAVNDASKDGTLSVLEKFGSRIRLINHPENMGLCRSSNDAIKAAKYPYVALITQDCKAKRTWLRGLMEGITPDIDVIAGISEYQYTSTICKKDCLIKAGLFDEDYGRSGYRADTDMMFRLKDIGCRFAQAKRLDYEHAHEKPEGARGKINYLISRVKNHVWDPLLYKKHPERTKKMFGVMLGFMISPLADFKTATGLWKKSGRLELSSPQGIRIIENKTPLHTLLIVFSGIGYAFLVKLARLRGSARFGKLLI